MMTHLKEGDPAPTFKALNHIGRAIKSERYRGKKLILFFYPKDDTPSCTKEACSLKTGYRRLKKYGFEVIGISPDTVRRHKNFKVKYKLPYTLLADPEKKIIQEYGVWGPKMFMGREVIGVHRTTFIINEEGIIEKIIDKVITKEHDKQIIELMGLKEYVD